jgi:23S rRNA (pseudouridine1915-N3)-methyltransferase
MQFTVAAVGKPRDAALAAAIHEYEMRAARYWPLSFIQVREESARGRTPVEVRAREGDRLRAAAPSARLWICDPRGLQRSSEDFARWMQQLRENALDVAIVIGGALGIDDATRATAAGSISLGTLTFPHEMARLILAEQLYRAGTIVRGEPYHK